MKAFAALFGMALMAPLGLMAAQDGKSPDLQQQTHPENNPPADAHKPGTNPDAPAVGEGKATDRSPDQQQDSATKASTKHKHKKTSTDARQAHGTPHPTPSDTAK